MHHGRAHRHRRPHHPHGPRSLQQRPSKVARVGLLSAGSPRSARQWVALDQRLRELGYVEGHTLETAFRNPEGRVSYFASRSS